MAEAFAKPKYRSFQRCTALIVFIFAERVKRSIPVATLTGSNLNLQCLLASVMARGKANVHWLAWLREFYDTIIHLPRKKQRESKTTTKTENSFWNYRYNSIRSSDSAFDRWQVTRQAKPTATCRPTRQQKQGELFLPLPLPRIPEGFCWWQW